MNTIEKIEYLFSKINWADSPLDAQAVEIMNGLKGEIQEKETRIKELRDQVGDLYSRLSDGRDYLMQVEWAPDVVQNTLEALGYGRNGLRQ